MDGDEPGVPAGVLLVTLDRDFVLLLEAIERVMEVVEQDRQRVLIRRMPVIPSLSLSHFDKLTQLRWLIRNERETVQRPR